jgi:peroxiredoxin
VNDPLRAGRSGGPGALLLIVGVLLVSAALGFLAYRVTRPPPQTTLHATAQTRPPAPHPAGSPTQRTSAESSAASAHPLPERLPQIALPGLDGRTHRLAEWTGRPLVVNFWATWCDPCRREIPLLRTLRHERAAEGLEVIGIAVDSADAVRTYAAKEGIDYPVLVGEDGALSAVGAFGMEAVLPFSVFADRQGRILTLKIGELHPDEAQLILERLRDLDTGKLTLADARQQLSAGMQRLNAARAASGG